MHKTLLYLFLPLLLTLFQQCTLDNEAGGSQNPALTLNASNNLSLINLSWTPVKVTGFKEYVLVQSTKEIPDSPTPEASGEVTVLARINDVDQNSFSTSNTLFSMASCYKLYASVDDRYLYSASVCINNVATIFPGFNDKVDHTAGSDELAMFDRLTGTLSVYNYQNNSLTNSITETSLSFPILDIAAFEGTDRLYAYDQSFNVIHAYSFPQLDLQQQVFAAETVLGGVANGPFIFLVTQSTGSGFQIRNASTFNTIDFRQGSQGNRNIAVFEGDPLTVLEIGDGGINLYRINPQGKITSTDKLVPGVSQTSLQNTADVNSQYYLGGRFASLVTKDGEVKQNLIAGNNTFTQLCRFTPDGNKALVLFTDNITTSLDIFDITALPATPRINSYPLPSATYSDLFVDENVIYIVGITFNSGSATTFILKFPL